jgi:hypothetical protein
VKFDHFCWWLSTTIADGNHSRFYIFICISVLHVTFMLTAAVAGGVSLCLPALFSAGKFGARNFCHAGSLLLSLLSLALLLPYAGLLYLFILHTYLVLTNQTSWEVFGGSNKVNYLAPYGIKGAKNSLRGFPLLVLGRER